MFSCSAFALNGKNNQQNNRDKCCKQSHEQHQCDQQNPGRCGKRKGDCYGVRNPVNSPQEARTRFMEYFSESKMRLSDVTDKKWRYEAELIDSSGKIVDRVMIDKRSGRIRSMF